MKRINVSILLLCLFLFSPVVCAQSSAFRISGSVSPRYNGELVTLFTFTGYFIRSVDSTYVENGRFSFSGSEYLYEKSLISIGNYPDTVLIAELFLERGDLEVELKQKSVVHSLYMTEYRQYIDSCRSLERAVCVKGKDQSFYDAGWERFFAYKFQFKQKYMHNGIGRSLFLDEAHFRDDPYFYKLYDLLPARDKVRYDVTDTYEFRKKRDEQNEFVGKPFLDFTLVNAADEKKRIADYVGKSELLFLDFWASWCGPCMAQEPQLKKLYQKYKNDGFEVLGISLDTTKKNWLRAIEKKGLSWPELSVGNQTEMEELRKLYKIVSIPYGILVDRFGRVIYIVNGQWQQLQMILESYYKK